MPVPFGNFRRNIATVASIVASLSIIIGAIFAIETRYAKAADIEQYHKQNEVILERIRLEQKLAIDTLRQQQISDKLFELRLNENPSTVDRAMIKRYEEQLQRLNQQFLVSPNN